MPDSSQKRWQRLPGRARRYYDTQSGREISDRQYRALSDEQRNAPRFRISGPRLTEQRIKQRRYNHLVQAFVDQSRKDGVDLTYRQVRNSPTFKNEVLSQLNARNKDGSKSIRKVKQALVQLGLREGIPDWVRPGDSPKYKRIRATVATDSEARRIYTNRR